MLSQAIYNVAKAQGIGLVQGIDRKVVPNQQSVISTLMNMSYVSGKGRDNVAVDIESVTTDSSTTITPHSALVGSEGERIGPMVQAHVAFVQNVVSPKFVEMQGKLQEFIDQASKRGPSADFDIRTTTVAPIVTNESVRGLVQRFAQDGSPEPARVQSLPVMTYEELLGFVKTSSSSVDSEIRSWLGEKGPEWLLDIWAYYFASQNQTLSSNPAFKYEDGVGGLMKLPIYARAEIATALFLLSRGLYDKPPAEGATMTLQQWRANMDSYSRYCANVAIQACKLVEIGLKNKVVVLNVSNGGKTATVLGPNYNAWLEAGGSPEVLMGAMVSGKQTSYSARDLDDTDNNFRGLWDNYARITAQTSRARLDSAVRAHAMSLFTGMHYDFSPEEKTAFAEQGDVFASMATKAKTWLAEIPTHTAMCAETVALNLTARIRYSHTPAFQFLGDMLEMQKLGCTDPREAATVAALNYLGDILSPHLSLVQA